MPNTEKKKLLVTILCVLSQKTGEVPGMNTIKTYMKPSITMLKNMEERGWVKKIFCPDARFMPQATAYAFFRNVVKQSKKPGFIAGRNGPAADIRAKLVAFLSDPDNSEAIESILSVRHGKGPEVAGSYAARPVNRDLMDVSCMTPADVRVLAAIGAYRQISKVVPSTQQIQKLLAPPSGRVMSGHKILGTVVRLRKMGLLVDPPEEVTSTRPGPTAMTGYGILVLKRLIDSLKEKPKKFRTRRVKQVLEPTQRMLKEPAGIDEHGVGDPDEFGLNDTFLDAGTSAIIENRELLFDLMDTLAGVSVDTEIDSAGAKALARMRESLMLIEPDTKEEMMFYSEEDDIFGKRSQA